MTDTQPDTEDVMHALTQGALFILLSDNGTLRGNAAVF